MPTSSNELFDLSPLEDKAFALVKAAKRAGADACDAVVGASRATGVEVRNGDVEETESSENNAFSLRVFVGKRSASVSANAPGNIDELAERACAMARVSPEDPFAGLASEELLASSFPDLDLFDPAELTFEDMRRAALECEQAALDVKGVEQTSGASVGRSLGGTVLVTSHGFAGSYRASRYSVGVSAVAGSGSGMQRDYDMDSQRHWRDMREASSIGHRAGERAVASLNPRQAETQTVPVVYDPRVARSLVSHVAAAVNASSVTRKTSFLRDALGEPVFKPNISIVDEPHLVRGSASRPFDGEGVLPASVEIVSSGVLNNWLLDTATANELSLKTNGRANRAGSGTAPGSTNLTLQAGESSPDELIKGVAQGIYVTQLIGQGVNMVTGDYSRGVSGFWIENGELTHPVSEITVASNLRHMFAQLEPANDLDKRFGTNAPTVLIEGMTVAGT